MQSPVQKKCRYCDVILNKDIIGLNRKLFELNTKQGQFMCLSCMADYLECTAEELLAKIEEFKLEGCKLFS